MLSGRYYSATAKGVTDRETLKRAAITFLPYPWSRNQIEAPKQSEKAKKDAP